MASGRRRRGVGGVGVLRCGRYLYCKLVCDNNVGGSVRRMRRWLLAALLAPPARAALSCVDEDGSPVDWWFLYKQPRWADKGRQEPVGNGEGDTYVYASSARNYEWKVGATVVNSSTCLLGKNLEGIYDGTVENFVFYNDQLPFGSWSL